MSKVAHFWRIKNKKVLYIKDLLANSASTRNRQVWGIMGEKAENSFI